MKNTENEVFRKTLEEALPLGRDVKIIEADPIGIFALEKPAGILTHPNRSGLSAAKNALFLADYSLKNECYACRTPNGKIQKVYVLNRLDSPTSGIVLAATNEKLSAIARRAFLARTVQKKYYAVVCGKVTPAIGSWKNFLRRMHSRDGILRVEECRENSRDALFAEAEYAVVAEGTFSLGNNQVTDGTLLQFKLKTGRTHQLRVQCALRKTPILGDKTYGDFHLNSRISGVTNRLFLHSAETKIVFSWFGKDVEFSAASTLPPEFLTVLQEKGTL